MAARKARHSLDTDLGKAPRSGSRRPGRPAGDNVDRRARLIDAALILFARNGIAATPLHAIARDARVTPALLHYYFGDREQLIEAMFTERLQPLIDGMGQDLADTAMPDVSAVFVRRIFELAERNPWLPGLWVREFLAEGGVLRQRLLAVIAPSVPKRLHEAFSNARAAGQLDPDLDPRLMVVSMVGLTLFAVAAAPIWRSLFQADDITTEDLTRHVLALLAHGTQAPR